MGWSLGMVSLITSGKSRQKMSKRTNSQMHSVKQNSFSQNERYLGSCHWATLTTFAGLRSDLPTNLVNDVIEPPWQVRIRYKKRRVWNTLTCNECGPYGPHFLLSWILCMLMDSRMYAAFEGVAQLAERHKPDRHTLPNFGPKAVGYRYGRGGCRFESCHPHSL